MRQHLAAALGRRPWWRAVFAAAIVGILILALMPSQGGPSPIPHADKLRHAAAFIVLWALGHRAGLRQPTWLLAVGLMVFGVAIEVAQSFTPDRDPSVGDILADALGIAAGRWLLRRAA